MLLLWLLGLVSVCHSQYPAWEVTSIFQGVDCTGPVVLEYGVPTSIPGCTATGACVQAPDNANNTFNLPGAYQTTSCRNFLPGSTLAYKFQKGLVGTGDCLEFVEGYGALNGCNTIESNSTLKSFLPMCYTNFTAVWGFTDTQCQSMPTLMQTLDVSQDAVSFPKCLKLASDNQTSWLTTCPTIAVFGGALMTRASMLMMWVTVGFVMCALF